MISTKSSSRSSPDARAPSSVTDFVDLDDIDPIFFKATYYLGPQGEARDQAYALLREAMASANKVGIATFVMRVKQYLVAIRPEKSLLALETMYFADEVRDPVEEIDGLTWTKVQGPGARHRQALCRLHVGGVGPRPTTPTPTASGGGAGRPQTPGRGRGHRRGESSAIARPRLDAGATKERRGGPVAPRRQPRPHPIR